ncbi:oligopeptide-binding protein OppA precursor [Clostridium homopropionicum DSM 5847]|uniref:Oligopeptide-binding protein OppA n=1 Tax=Clostridium homopropionicum DSM 5847 TaxID=1121318 RepID=A0A0L6ZB85_9CLOT|nr:peptide ABC transporter substrate-binding protein [Clostridium homopropionicum]KOA20220.1 oligopeptide-binding protein OppA precursor [Clostridium homopropionicum DSM 5847]SFG58657.1 oligopeptide transport system substrate-binding protein [Clostridium homopropionicum]
MVIANMFIEGLMRFGKEEGKYEPGIAESYKFDEAANSYTFKLRKDAKWSDGTPVTADDFFFAWRLALDEQTVYSFMISQYIKGADAYAAVTKKSFLSGKDASFKALVDSAKKETNADKKKEINAKIADRQEKMTDAEKTEFKKIQDDLWSKVGVKAEGENLTIQLAGPTPYFIGLTAFPVFYPMNKAFYEKHKADNTYGLEAAGLNSNGPWKVTEWKHKDSFKLVKNENYWNKNNIKIDEINLKVVDKVETRTNLLKTGKLDGSAIQAKDLPEFQDLATRDQLKLQDMVDRPDYSVFYVDFNQFNNKTTMNVNIRKALTLAMDRKSFVEKINLGDKPALAFVPESFPGLSKSFREENGVELIKDNDKEQAKQYLAKGLQELGLKQLPALDMVIEDTDIAQKMAVKFQQDWKEIGVTVNLVPVPWGEKLRRLKAGQFAICSDGWGPDYMDPMTYLDLFESTNGNNYGKFNNPEYDKLISSARTEKDAAKRMDMLYKAEKMLIDNAVTAPQYFRIAHYVYKNYLTGVVNRGAGPDTDFYWADIDMKAKAEQAK